MSGDRSFWLNPQNGAAIARNVTVGLVTIKPRERENFLSDAEAFKSAPDRDVYGELMF
jgi:ABC-type Zn uptake system ZnuABC Zn-binding protein ZnuA